MNLNVLGGIGAGVSAGLEDWRKLDEEKRRKQEFDMRKEQFERQKKDWRTADERDAELRTAAARSSVDAATVLTARGPDGQAIRIPVMNGGNADTVRQMYEKSGYTFDGAPITDQRALNVGSRTLGIYDAEDPSVRTAQQAYDKGQLARLAGVYEKFNDPRSAIALRQAAQSDEMFPLLKQGTQNQLDQHPLTMESLRNQIEGQRESIRNAPLVRQNLELSNRGTQQQIDARDLAMAREKMLEAVGRSAMNGNYQGAADFINQNHPMGDRKLVVTGTNAKGGATFGFVDKDNKVSPGFTVNSPFEFLGYAQAHIDPTKAHQWYSTQARLQQDQMQHEALMARIRAAGGAQSAATYAPTGRGPNGEILFTSNRQPGFFTSDGKPYTGPTNQVKGLDAATRSGVRIEKTDTGMVAFSNATGEPIYNVSPTGLKLPLGMSEQQYSSLVGDAKKLGLQPQMVQTEDGRLALGFPGKDGQIYDNPQDAWKAKPKPEAKPGPSQNAAQPAPASTQSPPLGISADRLGRAREVYLAAEAYAKKEVGPQPTGRVGHNEWRQKIEDAKREYIARELGQ